MLWLYDICGLIYILCILLVCPVDFALDCNVKLPKCV